MAFSDSTISQAWTRAGGSCECTRASHGHWGRCGRTLSWNFRGSELQGGWEAHHITAGGSDSLSNCEILCQDCHKKTQSYGG